MTIQGRSADMTAVALFWVLAVVMFHQVLFGGAVLSPVSPNAFEPWASENPDWSGTVNPLMGDHLVLSYPWRTYNAEGLREGQLRFWNPYIFSGYPHLAALQSNALYPPVVLFDLIDPVAGIGWTMALHFGLAGTLMFWFLRRLGLETMAAAVGGVAFELSGFFMVRMSAPSYVFTGIWTPLLLLGCLELIRGEGPWRGRYWQGRYWQGTWKVAAATALGLLGGHPQILVLMLGMAGVWSLLLAAAEDWRQGGRRLAVAAVAVFLGLGLAGVQLLPFVELLGETGRGDAPLGAYHRLGMPFVVLAQAVVPDLFGHSVDRSYWLPALDGVLQGSQEPRFWGWNYCGQNLYAGVVPWLLAVVAVVWSRRPAARWFGAIGAVGLLLALGIPGVLHFFYYFVPSFRQARSDRILFLVFCVVAILAALGWEAIRSRRRLSIDRLGLTVLSLPLLGVLWQVVRGWQEGGLGKLWRIFTERLAANSSLPQRQLWEALAVGAVLIGVAVLARRRPAAALFATAVVLALIAVQTLRFGWYFNPVQSSPYAGESQLVEQVRDELGTDGRLARWRTSGLMANVSQTYGLYDANGGSNAALGSYLRLVAEVDSRAFAKEKYFRAFMAPIADLRPLLDYLGVGAVLSATPIEELPRLETASPSPLHLYRNPEASPRFFLVDCVETYDNPTAARRRFHSGDLDLRRTALIAAQEAAQVTAPCPGPDVGPAGEVRVVSYGAHDIELEVEARRDSLLVSSEVDYPGWQVEVDGQRVTKLLVNTAFRGAPLPAGSHRVRFLYVPRSFHFGAALSLVSACGLAWIGWLARRRESG